MALLSREKKKKKREGKENDREKKRKKKGKRICAFMRAKETAKNGSDKAKRK